MDNPKESIVFSSLDSDFIKEWIKESKPKAAVIIARHVPVFEKTDSGWQLDPFAEYLLRNYGHLEDVRSAMSSHFYNFSWTGSLAPYYQRIADVLRAVTDLENEEALKWVNEQIRTAEDSAKRERIADKERELLEG
jgi:hypothetical protein